MNHLGDITVDGQKTLGAILAEGKLRVPPNQREFAWKPTHVHELFQDIRPVIEEGHGNEYFLGTIVVMREPDDRERVRTVVDGQQRLATTAIFLAAVRDYFHNDRDQDGISAIEPEYLLKMRLPERRIEPQLVLNANDHQYFERRVLLRPSETDRIDATRREHLRPSHRLIHQAASASAAQVSDSVKGSQAGKPHTRPDEMGRLLQKSSAYHLSYSSR